jgi:NAD(P)-dependent dehydrogenase (short-subunit alcohol dehydrogenase family)
VNALIQSASLYFPTPLIDLDPTTLDAYYYVHLRAPHLLAKAFALRLLPADRSSRDQPKHSSGQKPLGRIIHITDASLNRPYAHHTAYLATKGALDALTRALAWDLAPYITVNNVAPGTVLPPPDVSPEYLRILEKKSPLGRVGSPEDVARAVQFLLEDPGFVTGSTITVDGGACMG